MKRILATAALALTATPALAHHPLAGAPMETFTHGMLSGIGHPILGFDHLFFIIAVGDGDAGNDVVLTGITGQQHIKGRVEHVERRNILGLRKIIELLFKSPIKTKAKGFTTPAHQLGAGSIGG